MLSKFLKYLPDPSPNNKRLVPKERREWSYSPQSLKPEEVEENSARPSNSLVIRLGQHCTVVGATESGKTYFTTRGLLEYLRIRHPKAKRYLLDSTDDPDMARNVHAARIVEGNNVPDLLRDPTYTLVWKPRNSKIPAAYAEWFRRLNDAREEQIVVIDEVASITNEAEEELEPLLKQMRKHGGTVIVETQSISNVDTVVFGQMSHFFQFFINANTYDLALARAYLNISKEEQRPPRHQYGFYYRPTRGNFPTKEYRDMRDFFGASI